MSTDMLKIHNKSVQLSQPYRAPRGEMVSRDREMRKILAAWMCGNSGLPLPPVMIGRPGMGKNRIIYECAALCAKDLYIFQGHEDVTAEDLVCAVRFSDDADRKMDYILSPVATAMLTGGVCFIDEIGKVRPRALAPLASVLDERRYLDSTLLGERVYAHPGFRFVAATNTADLEMSSLPDFIRSRLRPVITVGYPERSDIDKILTSRFRSLQEQGRGLIDHFWRLWHERYKDTPPTPRDSIYIFGFALNLADFEAKGNELPLALEHREGSSSVRREHIEQAFDAFRETLEPSTR